MLINFLLTLLLLPFTLAAYVKKGSVASTILVLAPSNSSAYDVTTGLQSYGIPFQVLIVPSTGAVLPPLSTSSTKGNFGGIVTMSELTYSYPDGWRSALTDAQWTSLFNYQTSFGVRMVRIDAWPGSDFGVNPAGDGTGCCGANVEQLLYLTDASTFSTAGLRTNAGVTTQGLWHTPATITDKKLAKEFASFGPATDGTYTGNSTAAVINNISGREQMVFFISWGAAWSQTSNYLQHAWIKWITRGLHAGYRRTYFSTQVDDMMLKTLTNDGNGTTFRSRPGDMDAHVTWQAKLNSRLPTGSNYTIEIAHNGNYDIENSLLVTNWSSLCTPTYAIYPTYQPPPSDLEFFKPLGSGLDKWPATPTSYNWSLECALADPLAKWFNNPTNMNKFMHLSHTFTHLNLDNTTYADTVKEITFNQAWLKQLGFTSAKWFSKNGLVPPAITGLHNGDAIKAWLDNGIKYVVGDNTRPVLLNSNNDYWPYTSNVASNGYPGLIVMPRYASPIYFDCDTPECTTQEWNNHGGSGSFQDLLAWCKNAFSTTLLRLRHDPYMFHQANMRTIDMATQTIGSQTGQFSIMMAMIEIVIQEFQRLTTWPVLTLKHDDLAQLFLDRQTRDQCAYTTTHNYSNDGKTITSITVNALNNKCSVPIPVTLPVKMGSSSGGSTRQETIGSDPLTVWVTLTGSAVTINLGTAITL